MQLLLKTACGLAFASLLTACVVRPAVVSPVYGPAYQSAPVAVYEQPPPGVVYVAPSYALPAPGFAWRYNARYGWDWHHPQRGWHRGWR